MTTNILKSNTTHNLKREKVIYAARYIFYAVFFDIIFFTFLSIELAFFFALPSILLLLIAINVLKKETILDYEAMLNNVGLFLYIILLWIVLYGTMDHFGLITKRNDVVKIKPSINQEYKEYKELTPLSVF